MSNPKIGDRKTFDGIECVWMPDPWAWNVSFPCWCRIDALEREGIKYP